MEGGESGGKKGEGRICPSQAALFYIFLRVGNTSLSFWRRGGGGEGGGQHFSYYRWSAATN